jgi:tetratricopeptide (TPR) repeat protein
LILVVGGLWYILSNKPYSADRLIGKYYKPAQPILQVRSMEFTGDDILKEAFNLYQQNNFENALKYFNALNNQIIAKFYSGICYIELGQFSKAMESFEFVVNDADNLFVEQAEWYLGLIYLMNNQKSEALDQFARISESGSYYSDQAKEIMKVYQLI